MPSALGRQDPKSLIERIGFDPEIESEAFRKLFELDVEGCRSTFGKLITSLDFSEAGKRWRELQFLLFDILQRANIFVNRTTTNRQAFLSGRMDIITRISALKSAEEVREAFLPALNQILSPLENRSSSPQTLINRAKTYIEENYHRRIALSMVSSKLNVSPNYLSRIFRKETGITLTAFIQKVRLEHAMLLLAEGGRSISEIAYLVGYQNYRDFYRNFVKYENASPRQVQRRFTP